jgi:hypothetical protein
MRTHLFLAGLVTIEALAAQAVTLEAATNVGVYARTGARTAVDVIPAGTFITEARTLEATTPAAEAALRIAPGSSVNNSGYRLIESAVVQQSGSDPADAGTTAVGASDPPRQSAHAFVLRVLAPGIGSRLTVTVGGMATAGAAAGLAVDVGNDGSIEWRQDVDGTRHVRTFEIGNVQAVRVIASGHAAVQTGALRSSYAMDASLNVSPGDVPCEMTPFGQGCGGATLGGFDRIISGVHYMTFEVAGAFPDRPIVFWFGDQAINFQIPGLDCFAYTLPAITLTFFADANGSFDNTFLFGFPLSGTTYVQAIPVTVVDNRLLVRTTNGLRVTCR